jgi:predicted dehydrogenase/ribosomal protein S18 acetylase RimI-like enzyme
MSVSERMNVGLVGAAGRGGSFRAAFEGNGARIHAVCDIRAEELERCRRELGASEAYSDYAEMIEKSDLDAVVVGTPMPFHVPQSILALQHNLHVLSEVPAGVSVEECKALVLTCRKSKGLYMMAENYTYIKTNVLIREIVRQGLFGVVYYAEGEYIHELKELNEITRWRRQWQTGIDGITYGTHSLGPILQWMPGDRVVRISCEGSRHHYRDPRGDPYHDDTAVMLCKTAKGALIKIRLDMLSDRPHCLTNYQLQGTDGCYESSRGGPVDRGKIWFRQLSQEIRWHDVDSLMEIDALAEKYLPELWRNPPAEALRSGHWGGDYFEVLDFVNAIRGKAPCPIGIHEAMDMTLPGLISQESISRGGAWLDVPDSRVWSDTPPYRQLHMIWPESKLASPPVPHVPHGYEMRQYRESDEAEYLALMAKVGFKTWDHEQMVRTLKNVLPGGFFLIVHRATGKVVATAMAQHKPTDLHPFGGEMGWVAADPDHKAQGLGRAATAAATARLIQAGYRSIYLQTDDFRLPALAIYLRLGFEPFLYAEGMAERWHAVREKLRHP